MKNHENKQMENVGSGADQYPHRNCNNTRYDIMHGVKTASPPTPPLKGRGFFIVLVYYTLANGIGWPSWSSRHSVRLRLQTRISIQNYLYSSKKQYTGELGSRNSAGRTTTCNR